MKKQSPFERLDWTQRYREYATRRTWEQIIRQTWKCSELAASQEFQRALDAGVFEVIYVSLTKGVLAYRVKNCQR